MCCSRLSRPSRRTARSPSPSRSPPSDELRLQVTDSAGTARDLAVSGFTTTPFTVQESSVDADLAAIAGHLNARIQAATAALGLPGTAPALLRPVRLQRIRAGSGLGTLVLDFSVHPDYGNGTARIEVASVIGLASLGLDAAARSAFTLSSSADLTRLQTYIRRRLHLAQESGGFTAGNRLLAEPMATFSGGTLTLRFRMSDLDGGAGSSLGVVSQTRLEKLGFDSLTAVTGVVTAGTSFVPRDVDGILGDVLGVVNDALGTGDQTGWLKAAARDFRCIYIVFLGTAPVGTWDADAAKLTLERMFKTWATATHPAQPSIQVLGNWITSVFPGARSLATACHELSHTLGGVQGTQPGSKTIPTDWCLGLPDTYDNDPENQNKLRYLGAWDMMSNPDALSHLAGYHKRHLRWIPAPARILSVPEPNPSAPTVEECWLVPIEHWGPNHGSRCSGRRRDDAAHPPAHRDRAARRWRPVPACRSTGRRHALQS